MGVDNLGSGSASGPGIITNYGTIDDDLNNAGT